MNFNTYVFVLVFFPLITISYFFLGRFHKYTVSVGWLLLCSLIYYFFSEKFVVLFLLGSIVINYGVYVILKRRKLSKVILTFAIAFNLAILIYFKYYNFFLDGINYFLHSEFQIKKMIVPLGISFITFQQIAFLIDTYRFEVSECNIIEYALLISFFPHVSSGPILTCKNFFTQLKGKYIYIINWDNVATGLFMFIMGLGKKVLIADVLGKAVDWGYSNISQLNSISATFVMIAYTFQIYFDFSGYSDMAMGIGRILNIKLPVNFNSPYKSVTIIEFWERWHITLTDFFTKYLYIPLGGSRRGVLRTMVNTMVVFLCSGIWHGASWTFLLWGLLHGGFMIFAKSFRKTIDHIPSIITWGITFLFVNITWVLFRAGSFTSCKSFFNALFLGGGGSLNESICECFVHLFGFNISVISSDILPWLFILIIFLIVLCCKNVQQNAASLKWNILTALGTLLVLIICILSFSNVTTYIYNGF